MPRATCRCGQELNVPGSGSERVVCPNCGARVRVRWGRARNIPTDGYLRFFCPCGRRLKVNAEQPPEFGKCPDCGRVVPVPPLEAAGNQTHPPGHPESPTEELSAVDTAMLDEWALRHLGSAGAGPGNGGGSSTAIQTNKPGGRVEAGLRVCPKCGKPVHLSAVVCRECGSPVPKR